MFEDLGRLINMMMVSCLVFIPLGIWKLIDIIIWICKNIKITL